jgi:indole-3-glycerol phosphate synthase
MHALLEKILREKKKEIEVLKKNGTLPAEENLKSAPRNFKQAIYQPGTIRLIAEIKFASPSAGILREGLAPEAVGRWYEEAGAGAISLITDQTFFGGDRYQLPHLKEAVSLPVLRKDFILDEIQLWESRRLGADAVLLIARILEEKQLALLIERSRKLGMAALIEVHDRDDLNKAMSVGAEIIGVNNRDLDTFMVDLKTTLDLMPHIPSGIIKVSESGIRNRDDIRLLGKIGFQSALVGTALIKSKNILKSTSELVRAGRERC